jgi:hypothetical protein
MLEGVSELLLFNANSAISCREHINFQRDDDEVRFVQAELDFKCSLTETTVRSTPTHYPDSGFLCGFITFYIKKNPEIS